MPSTPQERHNQGQRDGSKADFMDKLATSLTIGIDRDYLAGYRNGCDNPSSGDSSDGSSSDDSGSGGGSSGGCFLTSACVQTIGLPDDCAELTTLRRFRDSYLLSTEAGRQEVREYYALAPGIVRKISARADAESIFRNIYEGLVVPCVDLINHGMQEQAHRMYRAWMRGLATTLRALNP